MGRVEPLTGIRSLACGDGFMCASDDVSTYCWGGPGDGYQLGYEGLGYVAAISAIEGTHVVAGDHHACVLGPSGPLCWGENRTTTSAIDGRLGQTGPSTSTATRATRFDGAVDLSARSAVTCMRHQTGVECAGSSLRWITGSRLTGPDPGGGLIPGLVGTPTDLGVQSLHACAIAEGVISCWGWNTSESLGRGEGALLSDCDGYSCDEVARPVTIRADPDLIGLRFVALSRGDAATTCAIEQDRGRVVCWGENGLGQAGVDPAIRDRLPSIEAFVRREDGSVLEGAVDVACGAAFCCAIQADGSVECWGENDVGQLGNGTVDSESIDASGPFDGGTTAPAFAHPAAVRVDFSATE